MTQKPIGKLYCNDCRRFVSREDYEKLKKGIFVHKDHDLLWIVLPSRFDELTTDELNTQLLAIKENL